MMNTEKAPTIERNQESSKQLLAEKIKERHPEWPDLRVTFYFAAHANHHDMTGIEPHLKEADILLIERAAGSDREVRFRDRELQMLNEISTDPTEYLDDILVDVAGTTDEHRVRGLYGSGKAVGTIDIGKAPIEQRMIWRMEHSMKDVKPGSGSYEEVLKKYQEQLQIYGELQVERERMMLGNFESTIDAILESRPDLKKKDSLDVLVSVGSAHTTLRHKFTEAGIESERHFSADKVQSFDHEHELIRTYMYGRQPSEELVKRAFTDMVLEHMYYDNPGALATTPTDQWAAYKRRLVTAMDDKQMEHIFELWNQGESSTNKIQDYLKTEGFGRVPESAVEVISANYKYARDRHRRIGKAATR